MPVSAVTLDELLFLLLPSFYKLMTARCICARFLLTGLMHLNCTVLFFCMSIICDELSE